MKKVLFLLIAVVSLSLSANAQVAKFMGIPFGIERTTFNNYLKDRAFIPAKNDCMYGTFLNKDAVVGVKVTPITNKTYSAFVLFAKPKNGFTYNDYFDTKHIYDNVYGDAHIDKVENENNEIEFYCTEYVINNLSIEVVYDTSDNSIFILYIDSMLEKVYNAETDSLTKKS